jgi:hypothetical protein
MLAGVATGPLPKSLQQMLNEWCAVTPGYGVSYTDIDPGLHSFSRAGLIGLSITDPVACSQHPLYKTEMCTQPSVCKRGNMCSFAHDAAELRQQPADLPEARYAYAITVTQPTDASIEYFNLSSLPSKHEAKSELAEKCIRALGLKVKGQKLVPNDSWQTIPCNLAANERAAHAAPAAPAAHAAHNPIPAWRKKQLLEVITAISMSDVGRRAAAKGYESWVSVVGGNFGAMHPRLAQALRLHYGSFRAFTSKHRAQVCPPPGETTVTAPSPAEALPSSEATETSGTSPPSAPHALDFITFSTKQLDLQVAGLHQTLAHMRVAESRPNEEVLQIVCSAGADGIDLSLLKVKIETGLQLQRSVKTFQLSRYVRAYPEFFRVETCFGTQGEPYDHVYPVTAPLTPRGGADEAPSLPSWSQELLSPSGGADVAAPAALADGATQVELAALERLLGLPACGRGGSGAGGAGGRGGRGGRGGGRSGELKLGVEADTAPPDARLSATPPAHSAEARVAALEVLFVGEVLPGPLFMRIAALEGQPGDPPTNLRDALARLGALESMT